MSDLTPMLRQMADRADATHMLAPHEIRRAGERRRRRLVMATATCAVLGTVAAGLLIRGVTRDAVSVDPAGPSTATTTSRTDDRVGIIGPPPAGTPPTGPATSQLVASAGLHDLGAWVYADGRIINVVKGNTSDQFRGYVVRQLTPSGVEAMRSFLLDGTPGLASVSVPHSGGRLLVRDGGRMMWARDFAGCRATPTTGRCPGFTNPESWLPASAWEDATFRPFVPNSYEVCVSDPSGRLSPAESLPSQAADILSAAPEGQSGMSDYCRAVDTSLAREVADILDEAGSGQVRHEESAALEYELPRSGAVTFEPVLPDGTVYCTSCG